MNKYFLLCIYLLILLIPNTLFCQQELSKEGLVDYSNRAMNQIRVFLENIPIIASGEKSASVREAATVAALSIFSSNAIIEEQNKYSSKKSQKSPSEYFAVLKKRSEKAPILIDFEVLDDLSPNKLKKKNNGDGTISYIGSMKFKQYYCKLKERGDLTEPTSEEPNINCKYSDVTYKKVKFEITRRVDKLGKFWITQVTSIEVERVE